jgi:uncharacterized protein YjbJ (UPF0337 family)
LNFLSFPKESAPGTCLADTSCRKVGQERDDHRSAPINIGPAGKGNGEQPSDERRGELTAKEGDMNADILKGKWKEIKGQIREEWGELTDDEIAQVEGTEERLVGLLQKKYGYAKDEAETKYKEFMERYDKAS